MVLAAGATLTAPSVDNGDGTGGVDVVTDGATAGAVMVTGAGVLVGTGVQPDDDVTPTGLSVASRRNAGSLVAVRADRLSQQATTGKLGNTYAVSCAAGQMDVAARVIEATGGASPGSAGWWGNGDLRVRAGTIAGAHYGVVLEVFAAPTGDFFLEAESLSAGTFAILGTSTQAEAKLWARVGLISVTGGCAVSTGTGKTYLTAMKVAGCPSAGNAGAAVIQCTAGLLWANVQKVTGTYGSGIAVLGGTAYVSCQQIEDLGHMTQAVRVSGGTLYLDGCAVTMTSGDGVVCSSGTVYLRNCVISAGSGKVDLRQSGAGSIYVLPGCVGSGVGGHLTTSGSVTFLSGN